MSKVEQENRKQTEEPKAMTEKELYDRIEDENWKLQAEIRDLREQNDMLRRLVNTQIWLIDEYQRQLKRAGYADMVTRGI